MEGVKHYTGGGVEHKGSTHKMPDGSLHTGKTHSKDSVKLFHLEDLIANTAGPASPVNMAGMAQALRTAPKAAY